LFTAVIVDDEARNIALFSYYLEKYCPNIEVEASFTKKEKAIRYLTNTKPDILFLDIVLDEGSGFDILDEVGHEDMHVVMCTAHDEFALRAIRYQVVDYLLKPLEIQDLVVTVDKIEKKLKSAGEKHVFDASLFSKFPKTKSTVQQRLPISDVGIIDFVALEDIMCIESRKGTIKTEMILRHHEKGEFMTVNQPLHILENKLPGTMFLRISRTCVVNVAAIVAIHRNTQYTCTLTNGYRASISRKGYKALIPFIEKMYETSL